MVVHETNGAKSHAKMISPGRIRPDWYPALAAFRNFDTRKATWQLINTIVPHCVLWYLMIRSNQLGYWTGQANFTMAFAAMFSALEVVPLTLLTLDAWDFIKLTGTGDNAGAPKKPIPHKWAIYFFFNGRRDLVFCGCRHIRVPVNDDFTVNIKALEAAISADRETGLQPICVIGSAGTINTGAIDDLKALANLCEHEGLWFHVDGAIGAVAVLAENVKEQLVGIERADSVALDLHKWMQIPFEAGCVLVEEAVRIGQKLAAQSR